MGERRLRGRWHAAALAAALAACSTPQPPPVIEPTSSAAEYMIGPGDRLNVFVYRAPELSATDLPVRPDGRLSLPLIPDIDAAGRTPNQLAKDIEKQLGRYVLEPNVTVMVQSFLGPPNRQIRLIGEAAQPMAVPYREGMTVLDVMIEAKGLTRYAAGNRAEIIRRRQPSGQSERIRVRLADLLRDGDVSQDIPLQPGDTLVIPTAWF